MCLKRVKKTNIGSNVEKSGRTLKKEMIENYKCGLYSCSYDLNGEMKNKKGRIAQCFRTLLIS